MFNKKIYVLCSALLSACVRHDTDWGANQADTHVKDPVTLSAGLDYDFSHPQPFAELKSIAVMLPDTPIGDGIKASVELALLQQRPKNIAVKFGPELEGADIAIGPVFSQDTRALKKIKPDNLPALSFTSDQSSVGGGILSLALMPTQSAETIIRHIAKNPGAKLLILAPDDATGRMMAKTAARAANIYDLIVSGLFYYQPNNSEAIKSAAQRAAMFDARNRANDRAKEIIADILLKENLSGGERANMKLQLEKLSKRDTVGGVPFNAVLFLGSAQDSKTLASFLRYFDVGARDVKFYGTAMWDAPEMQRDITLAGSEYAALPEISPKFTAVYSELTGRLPTRLDAMGYDAAMLAIGAMQDRRGAAAYLLDPSGYRGAAGLLRLRPTGESERGLQIMQLTGSGAARVSAPAPENFIVPVYQANISSGTRQSEIPLQTRGVNPTDYIKIPVRLRGKYKSKIFGANTTADMAATHEAIILPEDDSEPIETENFQPARLSKIDKKLIDEVEVR